jgi:hypothetical protein
MDRWIVSVLGPRLRRADEPLVVDLGYGRSPVTTVELADRLRAVRPDIRVLGLELDPERVAAALPAADPPRLSFARGGFELGGQRPQLVRAANVLRQYDEATAAQAWLTICAGLADGGVLVEGTCDELGRLAGWVLLDATGPKSLTLACRVADLAQPGTRPSARPSVLAERLPKALIHHNVPGQPVYELLAALDRAWDAAAALAPFGPRQRWVAACATVSRDFPLLGSPNRWRYGELTVAWAAVAPSV